jgi:hypothetical protein
MPPILNRLKRTLVKELDLIETPEMQEITTSSKEMLLWTYFIGGMISDERGIIAQRIVATMDSLGMMGWADVEKCLQRYLWPAQRNERKQLIWDEVQAQLWSEWFVHP